MNKIKLPPHLRMIRGTVGKRFVIKHYKGGRVVCTKYPNMKGIVASAAQKGRRRLFKKATRWAKEIYQNAAVKEEYRKKLRRPKHLFQQLIRLWLKEYKARQVQSEKRIALWRNNVRNHTTINQHLHPAAPYTLHTFLSLFHENLASCPPCQKQLGRSRDERLRPSPQ